MRYGMVIDLKRCFGCMTCVTSCKMANNGSKNVFYNRVLTRPGLSDEDLADDAAIDTARGSYPDGLKRVQIPLACQHCANPACETVCPTRATSKDAETGIVSVNPDRCIGCGSCMLACPYHGVRTMLQKDPVNNLGFDCGEADAPEHQGRVVEKCTMCANRVARGEKPKCVEACIGYARFFGDLDDPNSEVSQLIAKNKTVQLLESAGTSPSVYYIA